MIVCNKCFFEIEEKFILRDDLKELSDKPKLMLHSCCGPCGTAVLGRLVAEFHVTVLFYNA